MRKLIFLAAGLLIPALLMAQLDRIWVNTYDGPYGDHWEAASGIAVDRDGYVYVCGYGPGPSGSGDYVTIKYDPTTGERLWVSYYDGPANWEDEATAIAVDDAGGVYVTGYSPTRVLWWILEDYATIKYNASDGSVAWTQYADGAARYNGPDNRHDEAYAIAVDNSGGVYVTGVSDITEVSEYGDFATIKYNASDGGRAWDVANPPPNVVDGAARYNGPLNRTDAAYAIAVDNSGGVYVTGVGDYDRTFGSGRGDYATIKYNASDGGRAWDVANPPPTVVDGVARYNGPADGTDRASAIAVDNSGGVYITGSSSMGMMGFLSGYATIKYSGSDGGRAWDVTSPPPNVVEGVARYYGTGGGIILAADAATAIAVDNSGAVYVTGYSHGEATGYDYATIRYNASDGSRAWDAASPPPNVVDGAARYSSPAYAADKAHAIAVDNSGEVYVTGESYGLGSSYDILTAAYDPVTGEELGVDRYAGSAGSSDCGNAIATDALGCAYVTGFCTNEGTSRDIVTIKYNYPTVIADIDIDPDKLNLKSKGKWVTGYIELPGAYSVDDIDLSTVAISAIDGDILDPPLYREGPTEKGDYDQDDVTDLMVKFSRQELIDVLVDMGYGDGDKPELTVTGGLVGGGTFKGVDTIELIDNKGGGQDEAAGLPERISLRPTSPNPFKLATSLSYGLPKATYVRLEVYSPTGQRVATLVDRVEGAGYHSATWNGRDDAGRKAAAGIYLCRFEAGTYKTTRKMQLLR